MDAAGLQKLTLLDYPGKLACTVFFPGCNLRCPFCHNASLVLPERPKSVIPQEELLDFLKSRQGKLDGVCITGGEPTLYRELPELLKAIRDLGFSIKLDTNGTRPEVLKALLEDGLVDYVAMDIKNSPEKYPLTCGGMDFLPQVKESVSLLEQSDVDHEFRTTVLHPYHTSEDLAAIGRWLSGAKNYFIQQFVDSGDLLGEGQPLPPEELQVLLKSVQPYIPAAALRGV